MEGPVSRCEACGNTTKGFGHETNNCRVYGDSGLFRARLVPRHFCCPSGCEFDRPDFILTNLILWKKAVFNQPEVQIYKTWVKHEEQKLAFSNEVREGLDKPDPAQYNWYLDK